MGGGVSRSSTSSVSAPSSPNGSGRGYRLRRTRSTFSSFVESLSGRSFLTATTNYSENSSSRPWSRISRRRWNDSTLSDPFLASRTAWPVPRVESVFLPEFRVDPDIHNNKKYIILDVISRGAFGKVYKVKRIDDEELFALKVLSKSQVISQNAVKQLKDEAHILEVCGHNPFIVSNKSKWQSRKRLYILNQYIPGGELRVLLNLYKKLPVELVKVYVAEIALVLDFLHNAGIVYRDLKPENILLDEHGHIQLIDFGLSKWLKYGSRTTTVCGTFLYMGRLFSSVLNEIITLVAKINEIITI